MRTRERDTRKTNHWQIAVCRSQGAHARWPSLLLPTDWPHEHGVRERLRAWSALGFSTRRRSQLVLCPCLAQRLLRSFLVLLAHHRATSTARWNQGQAANGVMREVSGGMPKAMRSIVMTDYVRYSTTATSSTSASAWHVNVAHSRRPRYGDYASSQQTRAKTVANTTYQSSSLTHYGQLTSMSAGNGLKSATPTSCFGDVLWLRMVFVRG